MPKGNTDGLPVRVAKPTANGDGGRCECALFVRHPSTPRSKLLGIAALPNIVDQTR